MRANSNFSANIKFDDVFSNRWQFGPPVLQGLIFLYSSTYQNEEKEQSFHLIPGSTKLVTWFGLHTS